MLKSISLQIRKSNNRIYRLLVSLFVFIALLSERTRAEEFIVLSSPESAIDWLQSIEWWGAVERVQELGVPRLIAVTIPKTWPEDVRDINVDTKKEIFYRFLLPLVMHANSMVLGYREYLIELRNDLNSSIPITYANIEFLEELSQLFRIESLQATAGSVVEEPEVNRFFNEALHKLDVIPPGLAMGQAAYESGYGTSRFALEGNALFGQWAFGDRGIIPERQRVELGNYRIVAFDWPFDSVRSYFINLNSHPAYEEFRDLRAAFRRDGKPLDSLTLADGLLRYSERGQEYVDTLKSIIRVNGLAIADNASFRDEPITFVIGAEDIVDEREVLSQLEIMMETGEVEVIIQQMQLAVEP